MQAFRYFFNEQNENLFMKCINFHVKSGLVCSLYAWLMVTCVQGCDFGKFYDLIVCVYKLLFIVILIFCSHMSLMYIYVYVCV